MKIRQYWQQFALMAGLALLVGMTTGCKEGDTVEPKQTESVNSGFGHPDWVWKSNIYEVNIRQYTPEGTFQAFTKHLPRLKEMGVDILWLMPVHPIGVKNRKGTLGSYYAVKDYKAVNPEYGTLEDLRNLVRQAHDLDMYVILDWVANHTAWDNSLVEQHPEWYTHDSTGKIIPPVKDWADVADLNYEEAGLQEYMIGAMDFWVETVDVDGFRCDVAEMVPIEFWNKAVERLKQRKNVFMLAEAEGPKFHQKAFNMTYAWEMHALLNQMAQGKKKWSDFGALLERQQIAYPEDAIRMQFTSNHDENSWNGTVWERMGQGAYPLAVLTCTMDGMPLVYSGQEAGLDRRLSFFEKDSIDWKTHPMGNIYTQLLNLRHRHPALWTPPAGGSMVNLDMVGSEKVLAYARAKGTDTVMVILNLGADSAKVQMGGNLPHGNYKEVFSGKNKALGQGAEFALGGWGYRVFIQPQ